MTHETLTAFFTWLQKELPAHEGDLVQRLGVLHRMIPQNFQGWPKTPGEVTAAMQAMAAEELVEKVGHAWRILAVVKREEALLF